MPTKKEIYRRYEKVFVLAYLIVTSLILALTHFPGSIALNIRALYLLAAAAGLFCLIFYFVLPERYIGRTKTLTGILCGVVFITFVLQFSGYDQSPFFFLYYLTLLTAAIYLGPRETIVFSLLICVCYLAMASLAGRQPFSFSPQGVLHLINVTGVIMVAAFASVLSHLIKQRGRKARSKAQKFSALIQLTQTLTSTFETEKIFNHVVESISQLMEVPLCFLWTVSPRSNELAVCAGRTSVPLPPSAQTLKFGQGLVGWVAENRRMIVLEEVHRDPRLQFREVASELGFASYLAMPLAFGDRLMGVLEIGTTERRKFSEDEINLLLVFAAQSAIVLHNSQLFAQENEHGKRLASLKKYRDLIQMSIDEMEVNHALTQALKREFDLEQIVIMKMNPSANRLEVKNLLQAERDSSSFSVLGQPNHCLALRSSRRFVMNEESQDHSCPQNCFGTSTRSYLCLPLIVGGAVTGVVHLASPKPQYWTDDRMAFAESFVDQTAPILSTLYHLQQATQRAIVDSLTGLYNRRFLFEFMQKQIVQAQRYGQALSILMLDLDHFKKVNDGYGHEAGDVALKLFAVQLRESLRDSDVAARYGGEEFVVVLPNTNMKGALDLAEKIRMSTLATNLSPALPDLPSISVSIGVSCYPVHGDSVEQLQRAADQALYRAKEQGRNCIVCADTKTNPPLHPAHQAYQVMGHEPNPSETEAEHLGSSLIPQGIKTVDR